jgi:guanylate kinase
MAKDSPGRVVVISGPSGAGKSTLRRRLIERAPVPLVRSVSATTRRPRPGEVDGVDYHFLSREEFALRRRRGEFLECFQVFNQGDWYGTLREEVAAGLGAGKWVLLEIDVQGEQAVVRRYPDAVSIFIRPGSVEELERRLRGRNTETEHAVQVRLKEALAEMAVADRYRYQVINDDLDRAVGEICDILTQTEKNAHA